MHVVITGGAGFLGSRLAHELIRKGALVGTDGRQQSVERITLLDIVPARGFKDSRIETAAGDVSDPRTLQDIITPATQVIFHLAAIVSSHAEADFELGMKINFDATRHILERARQLATRPRLVFTSSVAVFGGHLPDKVQDSTWPTPQSSYGAEKVLGEVLITDYSRRGYIDGRVLRLPTISVRPGTPNKAASSFASGIIREPLNGQEAICPVAPETRMWLSSPRTAVANLIQGNEVDASHFGATRTVNLPGLSVTVREMAEALAHVAGPAVADRIRWQEDEAVKRIVTSWPGDFETTRANAMGFAADADFESVVRAYIEDELKKQTTNQ